MNWFKKMFSRKGRSASRSAVSVPAASAGDDDFLQRTLLMNIVATNSTCQHSSVPTHSHLDHSAPSHDEHVSPRHHDHSSSSGNDWGGSDFCAGGNSGCSGGDL